MPEFQTDRCDLKRFFAVMRRDSLPPVLRKSKGSEPTTLRDFRDWNAYIARSAKRKLGLAESNTGIASLFLESIRNTAGQFSHKQSSHATRGSFGKVLL
jgi:hypothetical protein